MGNEVIKNENNMISSTVTEIKNFLNQSRQNVALKVN